jgi:hypothetical protein
MSAHGAPARWVLLRAAYLIAAGAATVMGVLAVSGKFTSLVERFGRGLGDVHGPALPWEIVTALTIVQSVQFVALVGVFVFLALRPFWWGKVICFGVGLIWIAGGVGFSMVWFSIFGGLNMIVDCQIAAGTALLLAALLHQIADPRFD